MKKQVKQYLSAFFPFTTIFILIFLFFPFFLLARPFYRNLPAMPFYSRDSRIVVQAGKMQANYRSPVLIFTERTRADITRATNLEFSPENGLLEIAIGSMTNRETRLRAFHYRDRKNGALKERIEIPDPEGVDLTLLKNAICDALLRLWIAEHAISSTVTLAPPPPWLSAGLVQYARRENRPLAIDRALRLWSNACLPPARELFALESVPATAEPSVAMVLASMLLEKKNNRSFLEQFLRDAGKGKRWTEAYASQLLVQTDSPLVFDEYVDLQMLALERTVVIPGITTAGIVRRFRSSLLLYPPLFGNIAVSFSKGFNFQEILAFSNELACRKEALKQVQRIQIAAVGRDGTLLSVAQAYEKFLLSFAQGEKPALLRQQLKEADALRRDMEQRTAKGEILHVSPPSLLQKEEK